VLRFRIDPRKKRSISEEETPPKVLHILYCIVAEGRWLERQVSAIRPSRTFEGENAEGEYHFSMTVKLEESYHEVPPTYAAAVFVHYEVPLPPELEQYRDEAVMMLGGAGPPRHAWGTGWDVDPRTIFAIPRHPTPPGDPNTIDFDALSKALGDTRQRLPSKLVTFMKDRESANFQDVMDEVHGGDRTEEAIRTLVTRTNNLLHDLKSRLRFSTRDSKVRRRIDPE
jgi:hypothetical protein